MAEEQSHTLIQRLRPWVSTFSEEIKIKRKHGDEICVGGAIKSIFNLAEILKEEDQMCQMEVDDAVGTMTLFIPGELFAELKEKYSLKVGDEIIATGKVYAPEEEKDSTPSVVCWKLELLSSKK